MEWTGLAARSAARSAVDVRMSPELYSPCLARAWRPVLLLPDGRGIEHDPGEIRAILAHELAQRGITTWPGMISSTSSRSSSGSTRLSGGFGKSTSQPVMPFVMPWPPTNWGTLPPTAGPWPGLALRAAAGHRLPGAWQWPGSRMSVAGLTANRRVFCSRLPRSLTVPATLIFGFCVILIGAGLHPRESAGEGGRKTFHPRSWPADRTRRARLNRPPGSRHRGRSSTKAVSPRRGDCHPP